MTPRGDSDSSTPGPRTIAPPPGYRGPRWGRCPCCGSATLPHHGQPGATLDDGAASSDGDPRDLERMLIRLGGNGF